jgi:hypothetical protein
MERGGEGKKGSKFVMLCVICFPDQCGWVGERVDGGRQLQDHVGGLAR